MANRHKLLAAVYLVLMRNGEVLLARRHNTGYMDGMLSLPSGHIEGKEGALRALIREAKEEVDLDITKENLSMVHAMHRNVPEDDRQGLEYIDLYFMAKKWNGKPRNAEPEKCSELVWCKLDALPKDMIKEVRQALLNIKNAVVYSEIDF